MSRPRPEPPRRGYTLIEMMAVMAGVTALIGLGVATINSLFLIERNTRQATEDGLALERLADGFRDDLHAAVRPAGTDPEKPGAVPSLGVDLPGGERVEYRTDGPALFITRKRPEGEPRLERLILPSLGTPRLSWEEQDGRRFGRLSFSKSESAPDGGELRVEALLGRDHRSSSTEGQP
jgi:type II secretory pathway pseudopilin PulG